VSAAILETVSAEQTGRNIAIVRELYESFADPARRVEAFEIFDPEIVWLPGEGVFDVEDEYHGHDGVRRFWRTWLQAWETVELQLIGTYAIGPTVVGFHRQRVRGRTTGIEREIADANIWTLEGGKVVRFEIVPDRDEGLRRAGFDVGRHKTREAAYDAWNRRDFNDWAASFQPDVQFVSQLEAVGGGAYVGREELRGFWRDIEESFEQLGLSPRDHEELGGDWSLAMGKGSAQGRGSGAALEFPFAQLLHWRGALIDWFLSVPSREEAVDVWEAGRA
jgi:ketosteroid isomerase-like protein